MLYATEAAQTPAPQDGDARAEGLGFAHRVRAQQQGTPRALPPEEGP